MQPDPVFPELRKKVAVKDHETHVFHSSQAKVKLNYKNIYAIAILINSAFRKCILLQLRRLLFVCYQAFCEHSFQGSPDTLTLWVQEIQIAVRIIYLQSCLSSQDGYGQPRRQGY